MGKTRDTGFLTDCLFTDSSNNVGIGGAANASYKLAVTGASLFSSTIIMNGTAAQILQTTANSVSGDNVAVLYNSNANSYGLYIGAGSGTNHALYCTDSTRTKDLFKVQGNGNIGIGTGSPATILHINSPASTNATIYFGVNGTMNGYLGQAASAGSLSSGAAVGDVVLRSQTNLLFTSGGDTERMRITSSGQISQTAPLADWSYVMTNTNSSSPNGILIQYTNANKNNTGNQFIYCTDNFGATLRFEARSNGGIGNYSGNNINLASDRRLKKDIIPLLSEWDKLKQIEVVNFKYKDSEDPTNLYGAIAQQVQDIYPELVVVTREATETEPEYYGLREQPFQWLTTKVLQEAMAKIEQLEAEVELLKNK